MFKKKLFGNNVEPACEYCERGSQTKDGSMILCEKKGLVEKHYHCRSYVYAPLKRKPKRNRPLGPHHRSEFEL